MSAFSKVFWLGAPKSKFRSIFWCSQLTINFKKENNIIVPFWAMSKILFCFSRMGPTHVWSCMMMLLAPNAYSFFCKKVSTLLERWHLLYATLMPSIGIKSQFCLFSKLSVSFPLGQNKYFLRSLCNLLELGSCGWHLTWKHFSWR